MCAHDEAHYFLSGLGIVMSILPCPCVSVTSPRVRNTYLKLFVGCDTCSFTVIPVGGMQRQTMHSSPDRQYIVMNT